MEVSRLKRYARKVGIDGPRFDECLDSGVSGPAVEKDMRDGQSHGVTGTPTFFVTGKRLEGAQPFERLEAEINAALGG